MDKDEALAIAAAQGVAALAQQDPLGAAKACLSALKAAVGEALATGDDRMQEWITNEVLQTVFYDHARLREEVRRLAAHIKGEPTVGGLLTIFTGVVKASAKADSSKRRLLINALHNAFDPNLYKQSLNERLFVALNALDYGDLHYLQSLPKKTGRGRQPWDNLGSMDNFHAERLLQWHLVYREALGGAGKDDVAHVTEFGDRMLQLIADPPPLDDDEPASTNSETRREP